MNLNVIQTEVEVNSRAKGWYDNDRSWHDECALLASEVSEMLEAYRDNGLADATMTSLTPSMLPKPEGVGSEAADVLIRLLDTAGRYGIDGEALVPTIVNFHGGFQGFGHLVACLHYAISNLWLTGNGLDGEVFAHFAQPQMSNVYALLVIGCEQYDIDLDAEVERKLAFNRTRPARHGGKIL